jgi:transcriptional regulator with GAF, ATPase, and Fis domain
LVARRSHSASRRKAEPFVAVHCGALPESLMEAELFGHEKGAFTNATAQKMGRFDLAGNGTLFFDEVSEMSMATQVKLLRVLQEREFMRVGGTRVIRTNARIVAATNKDLREEVLDGRFRDDLFYRLSVVPIKLPPLRERREDVPALAIHFLNECRAGMDVATEEIDGAAMNAMCRYDWPGNVRELRNIIERLLVLNSRERVISLDILPEEFHQGPRPSYALSSGLTLHEAVSTYEREFIEQALKQAQGVQTTAAELLGTTRRILRYRMEKLEISSSVN